MKPQCSNSIFLAYDSKQLSNSEHILSRKSKFPLSVALLPAGASTETRKLVFKEVHFYLIRLRDFCVIISMMRIRGAELMKNRSFCKFGLYCAYVILIITNVAVRK